MKKIAILFISIIMSCCYASAGAIRQFPSNSRVGDFATIILTASDQVLVEYTKAAINFQKICMSPDSTKEEKEAAINDMEHKLIELLTERNISNNTCDPKQVSDDMAKAKKHESNTYFIDLVDMDEGYADYILSLHTHRAACALRDYNDEAIGQDASKRPPSNNKIADYYKIFSSSSDKVLVEYAKVSLRVLKTLRSKEAVSKKQAALKELKESTITLLNDNGGAITSCDNNQTLEDIKIMRTKASKDEMTEYILTLPTARSACALRVTLTVPQ